MNFDVEKSARLELRTVMLHACDSEGMSLPRKKQGEADIAFLGNFVNLTENHLQSHVNFKIKLRVRSLVLMKRIFP